MRQMAGTSVAVLANLEHPGTGFVFVGSFFGLLAAFRPDRDKKIGPQTRTQQITLP